MFSDVYTDVCVNDERTELGGPGEEMREETGDEVVRDGGHVGGGRFGEEGSDVEDVTEERTGFGAMNTLLGHLLLDASRSKQVARKGVV